MTEDEAKTKWCPFASSRVLVWKKGPAEIINAVMSPETVAPTTLCIGSACMAWRAVFKECWFDATGKPVVDGSMYAGATTRLVANGGFCGLAGAPA